MPSASALRAGKAVIELSLGQKSLGPQLAEVRKRIVHGLRNLRGISIPMPTISGLLNLRNLFVGGAAAAAAAYPVKLAAGIQLSAEQMAVFTGNSEQARKKILELQQFSAVAFQDVEHLTTQMRLLMTRGINADTAIEDIKALTVLAAGSSEEFEQLTKAFADVASATRLNGEEMRQFKNTAFNPFIEIAKKTGESFNQLKDRMEAGGISFDEVRYALRASVREGGLFNGMLQRISGTLIGQVRKALAQFKIAILPIGEAMLKPITQFMIRLNQMIVRMGEVIKRNIDGIMLAITQVLSHFGIPQMFRGIMDAMAAGELKLAFQVAIAGIVAAWQVATQSLQEHWIKFKFGFLRVLYSLKFEVQRIWFSMVDAMMAHLMDLFHRFAGTSFGEMLLGPDRNKVYSDMGKFRKAQQEGLKGIDAQRGGANVLLGLAEALELSAAKAETEKARKSLADLAEQARQAAAGIKDAAIPEIAGAKFPGMGGALAKAIEGAAPPMALLDTRLAAQAFGASPIQRQQLDELKKIRNNTDRAGGIPVV